MPNWFPEGNAPQAGDNESRRSSKIADLLFKTTGATAGIPQGADDAMQSLDVGASAVGITELAADTNFVLWELQDNNVRVRFDGTDPTSTVGHLLEVGDSGIWSKALVEAASFIRTGASNGTFVATPIK